MIVMMKILQLITIFTLIGNVKSILIEVNNNIYNNIGVNNAEDELSNYASEFHVAFLRQYILNRYIGMIVLTKSSSPVQFNISLQLDTSILELLQLMRLHLLPYHQVYK